MTHLSRATKDQPDPREPQPPRPAGEPSWIQYASNQHHLPREELLARYRKSRNLPDDPYAPGAAHESGPQYKHLVRAQPRPPQRFLEAQNWHGRDEELAPPPRRKEARHGLSLGQTFAVAAVMAALSGGAVGYLNGQFNALTGSAAKLFAAAEPQPPAPLALQPAVAAAAPEPASSAAGTDIPKKSIATATLRVADVTGDTRNPIPLSVYAEPALPGGDLILKISGVPEQAYLTSGQRGADKVWALSLDELRNVKLMVPEADQPAIDLAVAAFERRTGELLTPVKTMTVALTDIVVKPASAVPPLQAATAKSQLPQTREAVLPAAIPEPHSIGLTAEAERQAVASRLAEAERLLEKGNLPEARRAFEAAWSTGAAEGALGLARSYDPVVLSSLKINDAKPDSATALAWYERAAQAGNAEATNAIMRLKLKP